MKKPQQKPEFLAYRKTLDEITALINNYKLRADLIKKELARRRRVKKRQQARN